MGPWVSGWSSVGRWLMGRWSLDLIKPKNKNRSKYTYIYRDITRCLRMSQQRKDQAQAGGSVDANAKSGGEKSSERSSLSLI